MAQDNGEYFHRQGTLKRSLGIEYTKCKAWRIDPLVKGPAPEVKESSPERVESHVTTPKSKQGAIAQQELLEETKDSKIGVTNRSS